MTKVSDVLTWLESTREEIEAENSNGTDTVFSASGNVTSSEPSE
ncbi:MAG: hypothetical protein WD795_00685 [Woeseia sp.]